MLNNMKIGIIGVGNMGGSIVRGLINNEQFDNNNLYLFNRSSSKLDQFSESANICDDVMELLANTQVIILGIKPQDYKEWLEVYEEHLSDKLFISIGAGISSDFLKRYLQMFVIAMPNIGSAINMGYTVVCRNYKLIPALEDIVLEEAIKLFQLIGKVRVIEEEELTTYIGLIGSSPAYFFEIISNISKYFNDGNREMKDIEKDLAYIMEMSAKMILNNENSTCLDLVDRITSKGGTTIEAINTFRDNKLEDILAKGIDKCVQKANSLDIN